MKYEAVFGDQKRFNEQNNEMAEVMLWHDFLGPNFVSLKELSRMNSEGSIPHGSVVLAMRRIIAEPKRWTLEDKNAGRLPDVGAIVVSDGFNEKCEFLGVGMVNGFFVVRLPNGLISINSASSFKPIETPEEKAQREEDEWVNKAWSETAVFAGVAQDEHDRLRIHLRHIYKAQLSGELQAPKGGE